MDVDAGATTFNPVYHQKLSGASIRLLRISHARDGTFTGRLKRFRLADAPPFYTVSYTWGNKSFSDETITLDTGTLPILHSLVPFLRMVSKHEMFDDKDWWWVDSLCINLKDGKERESQVSIMADVYKSARKAVVWLGDRVEDGSDCTGAVKFLKYLSTVGLAFDADESIRERLRSTEFAQQWAVVSNLLARPWWTRVWTLQEFILPREAIFACGPNTISRGKFKSAMYNIFLCGTGLRTMQHDVVPRKAFDAAFNRRRVHQWYGNPQTNGMSLVATIAYLGNHSASDARDRIYSVLGLITERDRKMVGDPEYTTSVERLYAKLVRSFWNEYGSLDIICFAHIFGRYGRDVEVSLENAVPSWTPDWRVYTEFVSPVPLMASQSASGHVGNFRPLHGQRWEAIYDAPGQVLRSRANVRFHENLKEMWCDGVVMDIIDTLGSLEGCEPRCKSYICAGEEPVHGALHNTEGPSAALPWEMVDLLDAIARSLVLDRQDKYLRFVAPERYVDDFLALSQACVAAADSPSTAPSLPIDPLFSTWFQQNRHLNISTYTLATLTTTLPAPPPPPYSPFPQPQRTPSFPPAPGTPNSTDPSDTFLTRFQDTVKKKSRRLMVTRRGEVGMAPCRTRVGDAVVVLFGCSIPLVLRRVGAMEAWQVVGEAYVHGLMNGEVEDLVMSGERSVRRIRLV